MQTFLFRSTLLVEIKDAPLVKTTEHIAEYALYELLLVLEKLVWKSHICSNNP